jgi:cytosine deaminase
LLLSNATLPDGTLADVTITGERIAAVTAHQPTPAPASEHLDLTGFLLLPAPAEPHTHLDKILTADILTNHTGGLEGAVDAWYGYRATAGHDDVVARGVSATRAMLRNGSTAVRTHVDVGTQTGLRLLHAATEVRERLRGQLSLDIVAFVDIPVTGAEGANNRARLREAMDHGADVVGGAPYRDPDPLRCQEELLAIAAQHSAPVDLHTDETLTATVTWLDHLADHVRQTRFPYRVTASHCVSLGTRSSTSVERVAADLAAAGIAVVCCPATNLYLQGREHAPPVPRGLTALRPLLDAGVTVAGGGDNMQDPFNPLGRGDPLDTACLLVLAGHLTVEEAYAAITTHARSVMGLPDPRLVAGAPAELLAVPARNVRHALAERPAKRTVIHRGRVVSPAFSRSEYGDLPEPVT